MNNKENIGILGCGWLGLPLGNYLYNKGYHVIGTTTREEKLNVLTENNVKASVLELTDQGPVGDVSVFSDCEIVIINIPPRRKSPEVVYYETKILKFLEAISNYYVKHVLFISSTSVYGQETKNLTEGVRPKPFTESGKQLLRVEDIMVNHAELMNTVIRFGGLIGYDRRPGRFFAGKKNLKNGGSPVNMIHRDDCIEAILNVIEQEKWGYTFNLCSPDHPSKKEFYTKAALALGMIAPEYDDEDPNGKSISPAKFIKELNYNFKYNNPLDCIF